MTISLPPELAKEYEKVAQKESKTKSSLFRDMFHLYKQKAVEEEFLELQRYGSRLAKRKGLFTEKDVERLAFEGR